MQAGSLELDAFAYTNTAAARVAWPVSGGAPPVEMAGAGAWGDGPVMLLPCDFATRASRCYWDRTVALDLTGFTDFSIDVFTPDPGVVSSFTLYFRSGAGWYGCSATLPVAGWQTLRFSAAQFIAEGTPAGWGQIHGIRLSPWKGAAQNTQLAVRRLRAFTPTVLLVRDDQSDNPSLVTELIDRHQDFLGRYGIESGVITQAGLEAGLLAGCRVAVLPYNSSMSDAGWTALEAHVAAGGKVLAYYLLPSRLEALLGVRRTGWLRGDFAAWSFVDGAVAGAPAHVSQASWNITTAVPNGTWNARVVAGWDNSQGQPTGQAAWLTSDHGFFLSHVLLGDDADQKSYALLCLLASQAPELWLSAATKAVEQIGVFAGYLSFAEADLAIRRQGGATLRAVYVEAELASARAARTQALSQLAASAFSPAILSAHSAQQHLRQAFLLSQRSVTPEFRAFWEHHATGPRPGDWPEAIDSLATNGFTAIFPNMLWGGLAHYASDYLPRSAEFTNYGDQIAACVTAAHARGVQVHVWKVNWNLSGAPQSFIDTLRAANRTQVTRDGLAMDWLCPSHPENLALETNSLMEVVRNYAVDGIHFDYIRYPGSECCYCTGCRDRFQAQTGQSVGQWPADVLAAGVLRNAFLDWRRAQITRLVSAVHAVAKALKPGVKISAAVFPDAPSAYDEVGQDWRSWIDAGVVDFLCPMDYTTDLHRFTNLVAQQLSYAAGRIPIYPGVGAHALEFPDVVAQVQSTRAARTGGFIVFELGPSSATGLVPALRAGALAPDEPDTDDDRLADSWEMRWFGNLQTAGLGTDTDGDGVSELAEYTVGTDPTQPDGGLVVTIRPAPSGAEISFPGRPVVTPGYQNAQRVYRLERTRTLGDVTGWAAAPGSADRVVTGTAPETVSFPVVSAPGETWIYRVRAWLQQPP